MADTTNTSTAFDALLAQLQASAPKPTSKKKTTPVPTGTQTISPQAAGEVQDAATQAAFTDASSAASDLLGAIARLKTGAISKADALKIFTDYQSKLDILSGHDVNSANNVQASLMGKPAGTTATPIPASPVTPGPNNPKVQGPVALAPTTGGLQGPTGVIPPVVKTPVKPAPTTTTTGTGTGAGSSSNKNTPPANTPQSRQQLLDTFIAANPNEWAIIQSDPSLQKTFADGLQKGWSADKFQIAYENSPYYINHQSSWLDSAGARLGSGKGKWVETYNNALHDAQQLAIAQGLNIDPVNFGITPDNPTGKLAVVNGKIVGQDNGKPFVYDAKNPNLTSWVLDHYYNTGVNANATAITNYFATKNQIDPQHMSGVFGQNVDQLKSWANDLGMNNLLLKNNTNYFTDAANSIASGKQNLEYFHQDLMNQSAAAYPIYGNQIKAGLSLRSIAAPYINTLSGLLETTPDQLDLSAPTGDGAIIRKALQGNGTDTPTSLTDFATQVRQDPRWGKTLNAQNDVEATAHKILTDFGVAS